jgi:GntR family carbon starvation induced transcriptional regulator
MENLGKTAATARFPSARCSLIVSREALRLLEPAKSLPTRIPSVATFTSPNLVLPFDPARNPTRAVSAWLWRDVIRGVFAPMERLRVDFVSKFYNIGSSPVREAIAHLSSTGLVVHEHDKGYRVAPVSLEDYEDVLGAYLRIYRMTLGIAMEKGDEDWEEQVVVQLHRSLKVPKSQFDDPEVREMWQRAYGELHYVLLSGCGSPLLLKLVRDIGNRLERYVNLFSDRETDRHRDSHSEHRAIVDALIARNADLLGPLIDRFFTMGEPMRDSIREGLKREEKLRPGPSKGAQADSVAPPSHNAAKRRGRPPVRTHIG